MNGFCILILVLFFTNSLDKAESVKLELKTFDEIFGEGWWDKDEAAEDLKTPAPTNFGQNVHHQNDRQQIEPNSTDQNPPLTESDHSDNAKNYEEPIEVDSNKNIAEDERKRQIVAKFHAMKDEFKQKGKYSINERTKIEIEIAKHLKVNRTKIYKWKKEFGLSQKRHNFGKKENDRKNLVEKFDQMKAELKRAGFKNSQNELDKAVAKELGLNFTTIYAWKSELGQTEPSHKHSHNEQKELMNRYYEIKGKSPKTSDKEIVKILKIGRVTLYRWRKQFKQQQLHPNSVDGHFVEENAAANVQENEISGSI